MRKFLLLVAAALASFAVASTTASADSPFPATSVGPLFISAQTVNTSGAMSSWFAPGSTVVFRAFVLDTKTLKVLDAKKITYFYVTIPNQPNVKLKYDPKAPGATARYPFTGQWTVPASYPAGVVAIKVLAKSTDKRHGEFVQIPVATSQLTISSTAPVPFGNGPSSSVAGPGSQQFGIYVDTVNGTSPVGAAKRPIGCAQTNVFKHGEQVVFRIWGFDLKTGDQLSTDNVDTATVTIPGLTAPLTLNYGAHGTAPNKVFFWSTPWIVPATFPLGDFTAVVAFKTLDGKTGVMDATLTIVP